MGKIYETKSSFKTPDISKTIGSLDVGNLSFDELYGYVDSYISNMESDAKKAEDNLSTIVELIDPVIGERFDNADQLKHFTEARRDVGIDENVYDIDVNSLSDPYFVSSFKSKVKSLYNRADVKDILLEQKYAKDYLDTVRKYKRQYPELYNMALSRYNKYRNGDLDEDGKKVTGYDLLPQEFEPIDVHNEIKSKLESIPLDQIYKGVEETDDYLYIKEIKKRAKDLAYNAVESLWSDRRFMNNLRSKYSEDDINKLKDKYVMEYTKNVVDISGIKLKKSPTNRGGKLTEGEKGFIEFKKYLEGLGFDTSLTNDYELRRLYKDGKFSESALEYDEGGNSATFTYGKGSGANVQEIKTKLHKRGNYDKRYTVKTSNGNVVNIKDSDLNRWKKKNPKGGDYLSSPLFGDGLKSGDNDTEVFIKDGYLKTNDINFLIDNGVIDSEDVHLLDSWLKVPVFDKVGSRELKKLKNKYGIDYNAGDGLFSIKIESYSNPILDKNRLIRDIGNPNSKRYDPELYEVLGKYVGNQELQDSFYEYFKNKKIKPIIDNVLSDLKDGKFKIDKGVSDNMKDNTSVKLLYLAHHNTSVKSVEEFLSKGSSKNANTESDNEVYGAFKRIDKFIDAYKSKYGEMPDDNLVIKAVESGVDYNSVYEGSQPSSAFTAYQILAISNRDDLINFYKRYGNSAASSNNPRINNSISETDDVKTNEVQDSIKMDSIKFMEGLK